MKCKQKAEDDGHPTQAWDPTIDLMHDDALLISAPPRLAPR